jgi:ribosomal protein S18 acetylase RimI-like enzyme
MTDANTSVNITEATIADVDEAAPLFDAYRQFYKQSSNLEAARRYLHARMERNESVIYLAREGERAIGFMQLYPSFSSISLKPLWVLNDLFVAPDVRQKGVGMSLLRRAQEFAIGRGARGLSLATATDNPAQKLYEKMGWIRDTQFYHYLWVVPET